MADLFTQLELEQRYTAKVVAQLLDDDGDGAADVANVAWVIAEASKRAKGILKMGWPDELQIETLVANDLAVKGACIDIAIGFCGRRRPEFLDGEGSNPYVRWQKMGEGVLKELADARRRSTGESVAGNNARVGARVNADREAAPLIFTATRARPRGPGGF